MKWPLWSTCYWVSVPTGGLLKEKPSPSLQQLRRSLSWQMEWSRRGESLETNNRRPKQTQTNTDGSGSLFREMLEENHSREQTNVPGPSEAAGDPRPSLCMQTPTWIWLQPRNCSHGSSTFHRRWGITRTLMVNIWHGFVGLIDLCLRGTNVKKIQTSAAVSFSEGHKKLNVLSSLGSSDKREAEPGWRDGWVQALICW